MNEGERHQNPSLEQRRGPSEGWAGRRGSRRGKDGGMSPWASTVQKWLLACLSVNSPVQQSLNEPRTALPWERTCAFCWGTLSSKVGRGLEPGPPSQRFIHSAELGSDRSTRPCSVNSSPCPIEKIVSMMTHREGAIKHWITITPSACSGASALCYLFQTQFRICFCDLGPIHRLPAGYTKISSNLFPNSLFTWNWLPLINAMPRLATNQGEKERKSGQQESRSVLG